MIKIKVLYSAIVSVCLPLYMYAADGDLDISFGNNGVATTDFEDRDNYGNDVAIQNDGKIVVLGYSPGTTKADLSMARYNSDGTLDDSFGSGGKVMTDFNNHGTVGKSVTLQNNGKIVVTGHTSDGTHMGVALARYNPDGSLDTSFNSDGKLTAFIGESDSYGLDVIVDSHSKIVVAGRAYGASYHNCALARFNADGTLDTSFASVGWTMADVGSASSCYALALQSDGKIVAVGSNNDFIIARYNNDGTLDNTFGTNGMVSTDITNHGDTAKGVIIQNDGKIVIAGSSTNSDSYTDSMALARYNSDGTLDTSFGTEGIVTTYIEANYINFATDIVLQPDGKLIVSGYSWTLPIDGYVDVFIIARYNVDGSLDDTFGTNGIVQTHFGVAEDHAHALALQPDGDIVVVGETATELQLLPAHGINYDFAIVRYTNSSGARAINVPLFGSFGLFILTILLGYAGFRKHSA